MHLIKKIVFIFILLISAPSLPLVANAVEAIQGAAVKSTLLPDEPYINIESMYAFVAVVSKGGNQIAINAEPPKVTLDISKILHEGLTNQKLTLGEKIATWKPPIGRNDDANFEAYITGKEPRRMTEGWLRKRVATPPDGTRIIAFGDFDRDGTFLVQADSLYLDTEENRTTVTRANRHRDMQGLIQYLLWYGCLGAALLAVLSSRANISGLSAFLSIGLYLLYEMTVPKYTAIRFDLVIIYPILLLALIAGVARLAKSGAKPDL